MWQSNMLRALLVIPFTFALAASAQAQGLQLGVSGEASASTQQGASANASASASTSASASASSGGTAGGRAPAAPPPTNVGGAPEFPGMQVSDPRHVGQYAGVVPGEEHRPSHVARAREDRRILTWPGFQMMPDGRGRFFLQTNQPVQTETRSEQGRFVVLLKGTRHHLRNNRRPLETQYFQVPVTRAFAERRGSDVAMVMELRAEAQPSVRSETNANGHFVFIEYPAWTAPAPAPAPTAAAQ